MTCEKQLQALAQCHKKHPRQYEVCARLRGVSVRPTTALLISIRCSQLICKPLQAVAAWCVMRQLCPNEVEAVESCAGKNKHSMPPQHMNRHCQPAADDLARCMDSLQQSKDSAVRHSS
ncbi:TPA: hypothetical protein ACH3X2_010743 [Trebouxia sp. C0005]